MRNFIAFMLCTAFVGCALQRSAAQRTQQEPQPPISFSGVLNIAAAANGGKVIFVTSQLDDEHWKAENLIDGVVNKTNGWASSKAVFPQDIVIAFKGEQPKLINKVVINPTTPDSPLPGRWINEFELFVSDRYPTNNWKFVMHGAVRNEPRPQSFYFTPVEAKYVLIRVLSNHGSDRFVSMGEIEIYEAIPAVGILDQLIARLEQLLRELKQYRDTVAQLGPILAEMPPEALKKFEQLWREFTSASEKQRPNNP
ncbi:MAG: discoidin domain-containing protein [Armatimonadota bacterium]|nr:discoidin domain-containing protein [Armatimonadota bacterium]MCX7778173.1 discoidin domain-containing protein [Armatimonadota bacterium]MDW8026569.1 discoidin domain-containing protein [Armatimonadota bacterium]